MALLSNIIARETSAANRNVQPDFGTWHGWAGSVRQGYKGSATSVGINWAARAWAGHLDRSNGLEDLDEESFVKQYGDPSATGFEFRKGESPSQVELRYQDFIDQQVQARRAQSIGGLGQFAGGMVGNMMSPADIALSAIPYVGMAKLAKATSVAVRTGRSVSNAYKIVDRMSSFKANNLTKALAAGEDIGYARVFGELGRRSFIEQGAEAAFVMYGSNQIGRDYGMLDAGADLLFGGTLISAINIPGAWKIKKVADSVKVDIVNRNTMAQMAEDGNIRGIMDILRSYDDEATGGFGQAVDANPRIRAILEMSPEQFTNDRMAVEELKQFIYGNKDAVWLANLKGLVPLDPKKPIIEARRAQFEQMDRIIESVVRGNTDIKLTSEDFQLLAQLGQKNRNLMALLSGESVKESDTRFSDPLFPEAATLREQGTVARREKIEQAFQIMKDPDLATEDFTFDQARDFLRSETKRHWEEIEKAQELAFDVFGVDLKKQVGVSKGSELGRYAGFMQTLFYGDLDTYVELGGFGKVTPSSLVFHETVHALFDVRPGLWKGIQKLIYSEPALKSKINRVAETRGYTDAQQTYRERPSILMEMMITERDFWEALNRQNKTLFDQFKELIARIYNEIVNFNTPNLKRIKPEDLTSGNITEFAERVVEVIQKDRARYEESLGKSDTVYFEPLDPTKIEPAARKAEEAIEGQTAQAEERNRVKETEAAKEVEKSAPKAALPALQVFKTRIGQLLQGDLGTLALDLKSDYKDIRIKVDKSIAPLGNGAVAEDMRTIGNVIVKAKKRTQSRYNHAKDVLESRKTVTKKVDVETLGEAMAYRIHGLREKVTNGELTPMEALQQATEALQTEELQTILTAVDNYHKQQRVIRGAMGTKNHKQRLKYVKSFLDGLQRRGVKLLGGSLSSEISSQMTKDMAALRKAFVDNGFVDYLDSTVHRVEGESEMKANERAQARLDASNALMWDLMQYYKTGEVPERFSKESEPFRAIGEAMKHTLHSQIGQLNELGAAINLRQDHMGIAYRWDNDTIRRMGRERFKERMREVLDKDKIREAHGGVMVGRTNQDGFAETMVPFDFEDFLDAWYIEATSPVKPMDHSSMDIAKSFSKSRMIHVKEGKEMDTLLEFSGHNSLGRLLQDQIRHRSELIAIGNKLGNNPLPNIDGIMEGIGIQAGINTTRTPTSGKLDKWLAKTGFEEKIHDWDIRHTVDTAKFLTGALDNPESHDWSFWGKTYRQISNLAFLWTSTISAINDIPLALATLDQVGATNGLEDLSTLLKAMKRAASRRFHGNDASLTQFYEGSGANMDAIKNAGARRMALAEANGDTVIGRASEFMFTVNGLNFWTGMMQEAFADIMTQSLGRMAKSGNWDPHMKYTMETMGFTAEDFKMMEGKQVDINGVDRLGPPSFVGTDLEMKLLNFFATYRDQAVIVPDASTQALVRFGTQAGTFHGEAIRSFFQYASFPTAMNRITMRKLMIDHGGNRPWTQGQLTLGRMMTYIGTMMMFGYLSMVMKDLARARGPVMPWEMGAGNWTRLLDQTGMLGVVGNIVQGGAEMRPSAVISPNFSTQWKMGYKLMTEGFGEALYAGRAYTGDNIPLVGSAITSSLAYIFQGGYAEALRIGSHFREERGTEQLFPVPKP